VRLLLLLSLAVLACAAQASAQETSEKEQMGLKGPVKTIRTKWYRSVQGEPAGDAPLYEYEVTLDREGRKVEETHYKPDGKLWQREVVTYDAAGRTEVSYNPDGTVQQRVIRQKEEFDKEHRTGRVVVTGHDGALNTEFVNKYDARGRRVEGFTYDREGKLQSRSVWKFGADGEFQEFLFYNGAGAVLLKLVRVAEGMQLLNYDDRGALVSTEIRRQQVCKESDAYGNCKSMTATKSVGKGGMVEEVTEIISRTYTYLTAFSP
jgi:hypothetical protein